MAPSRTTDTSNGDGAALRTAGNDAYRRGRIAEALELYEQACTADPNDALAASNAAKCILDLGRDATRAEMHADRALVLRPDWPKAHYRKGCALVAQSKFLPAMAAFQTALGIEPDNKDIQTVYQATAELAKSAADEAGPNATPADAGGFDATLVSLMTTLRDDADKGPLADVNDWQRINFDIIKTVTPLFASANKDKTARHSCNGGIAPLAWDVDTVRRVLDSSRWVSLVEQVLKAANFNGGKPVASDTLRSLVHEPWRASRVLNSDTEGTSARSVGALLQTAAKDADIDPTTSPLNFVIPEHPLPSILMIFYLLSEMDKSNEWYIAWSFQVDDKAMRAAGASEFLVAITTTNRTYATLICPSKKLVFDVFAIWDAHLGKYLIPQTKSLTTAADSNEDPVPGNIVLALSSAVKTKPKLHEMERFFDEIAGGGPNGSILFYTSNKVDVVLQFVVRLYNSSAIWEQQSSKTSSNASQTPKAITASSTSQSSVKDMKIIKKPAIKGKNKEDEDSKKDITVSSSDNKSLQSKSENDSNEVIEVELKKLDEYIADDPTYVDGLRKPSGTTHQRKKSVTFDTKPPEEMTFPHEYEEIPLQYPPVDDRHRAHYPLDSPVRQNGLRKQVREDAIVIALGLVGFLAALYLGVF